MRDGTVHIYGRTVVHQQSTILLVHVATIETFGQSAELARGNMKGRVELFPQRFLCDKGNESAHVGVGLPRERAVWLEPPRGHPPPPPPTFLCEREREKELSG